MPTRRCTIHRGGCTPAAPAPHTKNQHAATHFPRTCRRDRAPLQFRSGVHRHSPWAYFLVGYPAGPTLGASRRVRQLTSHRTVASKALKTIEATSCKCVTHLPPQWGGSQRALLPTVLIPACLEAPLRAGGRQTERESLRLAVAQAALVVPAVGFGANVGKCLALRAGPGGCVSVSRAVAATRLTFHPIPLIRSRRLSGCHNTSLGAAHNPYPPATDRRRRSPWGALIRKPPRSPTG